MGSPAEEPARRTSSQKRALDWMIRAFLAWLFIYMALQGQDGFFARTLDRIESLWVELIFLNIPLQILLSFACAVCAGSRRPAVLKIGLWAGALNLVLILVHIILSVATRPVQ